MNKSPSDSPVLAQANGHPDRPDIPAPGTPERIMEKIGFFKHPYLYALSLCYHIVQLADPAPYRFATCLVASFYLLEYICRRFCDGETCRSHRKDIMSWTSILATALLVRAKYREYRMYMTIDSWKEEREGRIKKKKEAISASIS